LLRLPKLRHALFGAANTHANSAPQRHPRYTQKLKTEFDDCAVDVFASPGDLDRVRSILVDMTKTTADFEGIAAKAMEQISNGFMPRIR